MASAFDSSTAWVPYPTPGQTVAAGTVLPALGLIFVGLRLYARRFQKWSMGKDDWLMLPALLLLAGMGASLIVGVKKNAIGYQTPIPPNTNVDPDAPLTATLPAVAVTGEIDEAFTLLMIATYGFIKLSIVFFYRRVFLGKKNSIFDIVTKITVALVVAWTIAFFFRYIFVCGTHLAAEWGGIYGWQDDCPNSDSSNSALIISELMTAVLVLGLPLPVIWKLSLSTSRKFGVMGVLLLGAMSIGASVIRLTVAFDLINAPADAGPDPDLTVSTILYWSMIEAGLALIAANLPSVWILIKQHCSRGSRSSQSGHSVTSSKRTSDESCKLCQKLTISSPIASVGWEASAICSRKDAPSMMLPERIYMRKEITISDNMV